MALSLIAALSARAGTAKLRLCGLTPIVREGFLVSHEGKVQFQTTWTWRPEISRNLPAAMVTRFTQIDDCKPSLDGKEVLIAASSGAIAIAGYPEGDTRFYATVANAHSIELLPNGIVVAAASSAPKGDRLVFFDRAEPDRPRYSLPLKFAHGVTWDPVRHVLWGLGGRALRSLQVTRSGGTDIEVKQLHEYPLPDFGAHDLVLAPDGQSLAVSSAHSVHVFRIATGQFEVFAPLRSIPDVKSIAFDPASGELLYSAALPKCWWSYTIHRPGDEDVTVDFPFYKIRFAARTAPAPR